LVKVENFLNKQNNYFVYLFYLGWKPPIGPSTGINCFSGISLEMDNHSINAQQMTLAE
jgi:hypothetical protein